MANDEGFTWQERNKISAEGWGKKLLSKQSKNGMWADSLYHHKWI